MQDNIPDPADESADDPLPAFVPAGSDHESEPAAPHASPFGKAGKPATLIICGLCLFVFMLANIASLLDPLGLAFSPGNGSWFPGLISHMFVHADFISAAQDQSGAVPMHLIGNLLVLFFLGGEVERRYGSGRFVLLYFCSGLLAAISQAAVEPFTYLVGASGAISGIMAAFVRHYPNALLYLYFIVPVRAWVLVVAWILLNVYGSAAGGTGTAFIAHLGGFGAGLVISFAMYPPESLIISELKKRGKLY